MGLQVLYDSKHGHTRKVAELFPCSHHVKKSVILNEKITLFICPTYGDEELPLDMEKYLCELTETNRFYVICELGNYYGYDDFEFGAIKIIEYHLKKLGWNKFYPSFSFDSLPIMDWEPFLKWKERLENAIQNKC